MKYNAILRNELRALIRGGNAHLDFDTLLDRFPLEHINQVTPSVPYTPWQLLEHMRITQWDILEFIRNPDHVSLYFTNGYLPYQDEEADEPGWVQTVVDFRKDLDALVEIVSDPKIDLLKPIPHAPEYTVFRKLLDIADHNAYHMGEFTILGENLNLRPEDNIYLIGKTRECYPFPKTFNA